MAGAVPMDVMVPTNGASLATLLEAGVPWGRWIRFVVPGILLWCSSARQASSCSGDRARSDGTPCRVCRLPVSSSVNP